jgi:uncharacterized protein
MPLLESDYRPPFLFSNGHLQTIFPVLFRSLNGVRFERERIETPDRDFLDLDWSRVGSKNLGILTHGLGGDSHRSYILGMVKALNGIGWDAMAWNGRGLSGEPNRTLRMTHSGATEDLRTVISHAKTKGPYSRIALIGFSLGGNITLKYLGEHGSEVDPLIQRAVTFSVPCHLESCARQLAKPSNKIYMTRFLRILRDYIRAKMRVLPGEISDEGFEKIKNFKDFDGRYVAPVHGFASAEDYWTKSSCERVLENIRIPTLLVNARNDPFLTAECFPVETARSHPHFFLESPKSGGHVGFVSFNRKGEYWSERRVLKFLSENTE